MGEIKLRDYQQKIVDAIRKNPHTILMDWPVRSTAPRSWDEKMEAKFQYFVDAIKSPPPGASIITLDSYAAFDTEASYDLYKSRYVADESRSLQRAGKSLITAPMLSQMTVYDSLIANPKYQARVLTINQTSSRSGLTRGPQMTRYQLNDQLPRLSLMRRTVQFAIKNWSSK